MEPLTRGTPNPGYRLGPRNLTRRRTVKARNIGIGCVIHENPGMQRIASTERDTVISCCRARQVHTAHGHTATATTHILGIECRRSLNLHIVSHAANHDGCVQGVCVAYAYRCVGGAVIHLGVAGEGDRQGALVDHPIIACNSPRTPAGNTVVTRVGTVGAGQSQLPIGRRRIGVRHARARVSGVKGSSATAHR